MLQALQSQSIRFAVFQSVYNYWKEKVFGSSVSLSHPFFVNIFQRFGLQIHVHAFKASYSSPLLLETCLF